MSIELKGVDMRYPDGAHAVKALDLTIEEGELMVLLGPSGCGKSTILRLIAGLETPTSGQILIDGRDVTHLSPRARNVAMVFQSYALYPHMSVRENLAFPLRMAGMGREERARRADEIAELLELGPLMDKKPGRLSGGQQQRVAMGRALVRDPAVFLLDEPLSNLDASLRARLRTEIAALQKRVGITTVYVTHDQVEAMTLGDRVAVLKEGRVRQIGSGQELYDDPADTFVASFIGQPGMNLLRGEVVEGEGGLVLKLGDQVVPIPQVVLERNRGLSVGPVTVGVRPEAFQLKRVQDGINVRGTVSAVEVLGSDCVVYLSSPVGEVAARGEVSRAPDMGDEVEVGVEGDALRLFSPGGRAIG